MNIIDLYALTETPASGYWLAAPWMADATVAAAERDPHTLTRAVLHGRETV